MVAPSLLPSDWASTVGKLKLTEGSRSSNWDATPSTRCPQPTVSRRLTPGCASARSNPDRAHEWATVMMTDLGFTTPGMIDMAASCVGKPNWHQYAVWDGERIIAVGACSPTVSVPTCSASDLPEGRGRGAQSALLTARVRAAQAAGCRWLVAETGAEDLGDHNTSLHNMLRTGFEPLYERTTWLWRE